MLCYALVGQTLCLLLQKRLHGLRYLLCVHTSISKLTGWYEYFFEMNHTDQDISVRRVCDISLSLTANSTKVERNRHDPSMLPTADFSACRKRDPISAI